MGINSAYSVTGTTSGSASTITATLLWSKSATATATPPTIRASVITRIRLIGIGMWKTITAAVRRVGA